ncbi:MAG: peptidase T [Firmicutes bacterium]|nr:peptidase T [Bacillota bacterium]
MKNTLLAYFTEFIAINTQSDPETDTYPSTEAQELFAEVIAGKLSVMGMKDVNVDRWSYVTATLPANTDEKLPVIGLIAHMDTSPDYSGMGIRPNIINDYNGSDIVLKDGIVISPAEFPILKNYVGKTVITADGTTLLGGDDKAGMAEIFTAMDYLIKHPEIKHGTIRVAFTPDEEIGAGVDHFDTEKFGCDFAYTIDGGDEGEISYECFNAARAKISIRGKSVHPGSGKDSMINAALLAAELNALLPDETPRNTEGYEGFFHLTDIKGDVSRASLEYIIRDHDRQRFEARKQTLKKAADKINARYGSRVETDIYDEYYNMAEVIEKNKSVLDRAVKAAEKAGVVPDIRPIRGGTDGARLSFMGLPCPNLFTGGHNFHGPYEFVVLESMEKAVETILNIVTA